MVALFWNSPRVFGDSIILSTFIIFQLWYNTENIEIIVVSYCQHLMTILFQKTCSKANALDDLTGATVSLHYPKLSHAFLFSQNSSLIKGSQVDLSQ